jgi:hypothetical protein
MKDAQLPLKLIENAGSKGLSWGEIWGKVNKAEKTPRLENHKVVVRQSKPIGSKATLSKMLKSWEQRGYIEKDIATRKYRLSSDGSKYIQKSDIVDSILSSNEIDTYFGSWNPSNKESTSTVYNLAEIKPLIQTQMIEEGSIHCLPLMLKREQRTKPLDWFNDIIEYSVQMGLLNSEIANIWQDIQNQTAPPNDVEFFQQKIKELWQVLFKGVERLTVVETFQPQLFIKDLEKNLKIQG